MLLFFYLTPPNPSSPISGTKRQGPIDRVLTPRRCGELGQHVGAARRDRDDEAAALGELREQRAGAAPARRRGRRSPSNGARSGTPRLPSPTTTSTFATPSAASTPRAASASSGWRSIAHHLGREPGEHRGRVAGAGADLEHALARPRSSSAWQIAATIQGWEIVCPSPIGSAESA